MNHANLTARYRPQTFSELAGQETVRAILSRAAAENRVAPAYLFSGTRGVGKTTVARVFAKALNCARAPAPEPCNECENCRQITMGTAVDVVEIDGASNRGIDDVRKLKEVVGYAPMQSRYKIFIIDEAHMLSRDAFNALLKTLEEPPANVTFILATTEPHKFPATIVSRCQHYVFKRLPENGLEEHLRNVLTKEGAAFEEGAVRLLARRASGSVRDAMSLLGQVLALGGRSLTEADTRNVLGLAGQELFFTLFHALRQGNSAELTKLVGEMLDSGLDLGFFLREMTLCWRNMFILRQAGEGALGILDIPAREADRWKKEAEAFDLAHIHAAWQMTIDGQRRVLTSLEPALALELLLCNIAMLPRLLPLEGLARMGRAGAVPGRDSPPGPDSDSGNDPGRTPDPSPQGTLSGSGVGTGSLPGAGMTSGGVEPAPSAAPSVSAGDAPGRLARAASPAPENVPPSPGGEDMGGIASPGSDAEAGIPSFDAADDEAYLASMAEEMPGDPGMDDPEDAAGFAGPPAGNPAGLPPDMSWSGFMRHCRSRNDFSVAFSGMLRSVKGEWADGVLRVTPANEFCAERLRSPEEMPVFVGLARSYYGERVKISFLPPPRMKTADEIREAVRGHPAVHLLEREMGARVIDCGGLHPE